MRHFFPPFWPHPQHGEVPVLGIEPSLQQGHWQILNLLSHQGIPLWGFCIFEITCKSAYNLANTYYKLGIFASALKFYKQALDLPCKQEFKTQAFYAKIYHNLGNSFFMLSDLPQSIQAYKYALKLHPTSQSKNNLAYIQDMAANKGSFAKIIKKQKIQALSGPSKNSVELFMPNLEDLHKDLKPNDKNLEYKNLQHW